MNVAVSSLVQSPLLSIVVPTYNRKEMLGEALSGILRQSLRDIEVIVVDDCSSDGTEEYVRSIPDERVRYIRREKNMGVHYNYSLGLSNARGKYIVFHDDDDYYTDMEFFRKAVSIFTEHEDDTPPIVCVCTNSLMLTVETGESERTHIGSPGRVKGTDFIRYNGKNYQKPASLFPTVFRTDALKNSGLHNGFMDDTETYLYAMLQGDVWLMEDVTGVYRLHAESYTKGRKSAPAAEERRLNVVRERARQRNLIAKKLCEIAGVKTARKYYANTADDLLYHYWAQRRGFADTLRVYRIIIDASDFMPEIRYVLPLVWFSRLPRRIMRRITFLRRLYRLMKYGGN